MGEGVLRYLFMRFKTFKKIKHEIYVFTLVVLSRLPSLGYEMFTTDVWKWKQRIYDFGTGVFTLNFEKTIQRYHPGVSLMWIGSFSVKLFNFIYRAVTGANPPDDQIEVLFQLHFLQKLFIVIVIAALFALIFHILKRIIGIKYAVIATSLLALEPFFVALTRVVHLEGLQSTFMLASFLSMYMFVSVPREKKWLYLSSVLAAFAVLTKTSALFLVPFILFLLFSHKFFESRNFLRSIKWTLPNYVAWLATFIVAFVLIWPAMWTESSLALKTLQRGIVDVGIEGGHLQLFRGEWVEDPGISFYMQVFILRASEYLVVGLVGIPFIYKRLDLKRKRFVLFMLSAALLYLVEITIPSKKLDRYLLPTLIFLSLISSFFFEWLLNVISKRFSKNFWKSFIVLLILPVVLLGRHHPDYFSYYNILGGGLKRGIWIIEPKWVIGQHVLMDYLEERRVENNLPKFRFGESMEKADDDLKNRLIVAFPEKYYTQLHPFVKRIGGWATIVSIKAEAQNAKYIIFPVWFDTTKENDPWEFKEQVFLRGVPIFNVYTNTARSDWK